MIIGKAELEQILYGACFLASGGGGPLDLGQSCIDADFKEGDTVEVVDFDDIHECEWIVPSSGMGLPSASFNASELNRSLLNVIEIMQKWCQKNKKDFTTFKYIFPMEVGTVNSVLPIIAAKLAKEKGIDFKVVNADPSGRATPTLPLTLLAGYECPFYPNFIASGSVNPLFSSYKLESLDHVQECFAQMFTSSAFKNSGGFSLYPMSKKEFKPKFTVQNTMLDALNIGKIINQENSASSRAEKIISYMNHESKEKRLTKEIFYGTLESIESTVVNGTDVGTLIIKGVNTFEGKTLKVATENENIFANIVDKNGVEKPYIMGPDSISYLPEVIGMEDSTLKILDVTGLNALYNCPMKKVIKLHVIGIDAPKHVKECRNLIANWCQINQMLGGPSTYTQPWIECK
ncbi:DUF917 family protein [Sulfuricurvum sp.]|uniref:S-methyl thiohydantoin desulfurase domain-containing protein n=1 Tax=Sulfuricurvum sp. TaxID=2025608 RepID=UPI002E312B93|nr:DUF917 family protein [Sulfuricurvum sp.]HEX5330199.1 DUF917 family protein [Sulfuricurvum sp.]